MAQIQWLDEIRAIQDDPKSTTREDITKLISKGMDTIKPHYNIESKLSKLQLLLVTIDKWEDKAKSLLLSTNRKTTFAVVEELLREADEIEAYLPSLETLQDALAKADSWSKTLCVLQSRECFPYYDTMEDLVRKARNIPVYVDTVYLESNLNHAMLWKERTERVFLRKNSHYSLMESLSPRICVGVQAMKIKKNKGDESTGPIVVCDTILDDSSDNATVVAAFKLAEKREMEAMKNLRERNMKKTLTEESSYCVCRKPKSGMMLQCELCKDWFHCKSIS